MGLGIETSTANYLYTLAPQGTAAVRQQAQPSDGTVADPTSSLKAYTGAVKIGTIGTGAAAEATTLATLCEATAARIASGGTGLEDFTNILATDPGAPACAANYKNLGS